MIMARGKVDEAIVAAIAFLGKHFFKWKTITLMLPAQVFFEKAAGALPFIKRGGKNTRVQKH
jgi:hypothetical protein